MSTGLQSCDPQLALAPNQHKCLAAWPSCLIHLISTLIFHLKFIRLLDNI